MTSRTKTILGFILGLAIGALFTFRVYELDDERTFERGRQAGREECNDPSRLERAADWLAAPPRRTKE